MRASTSGSTPPGGRPSSRSISIPASPPTPASPPPRRAPVLTTTPSSAASSRPPRDAAGKPPDRSEEHTSELQSLMRISYAVFCLKKKNTNHEQDIQLAHEHLDHTE